MKKKMRIDGMKCMHCKANVEKALGAVDGVVSAEVNLEEKIAVIQMEKDVSDQVLMDAVSAKGFTPVGMI